MGASEFEVHYLTSKLNRPSPVKVAHYGMVARRVLSQENAKKYNAPKSRLRYVHPISPPPLQLVKLSATSPSERFGNLTSARHGNQRLDGQDRAKSPGRTFLERPLSLR